MTDRVTKLTNRDLRGKAAALVAADDVPDVEIAAEVGVSVRTLHRWKKEPEFRALVGDSVGEIRREMTRHAIAKKHKRLAVLDKLHAKALAVIEERAKDEALAEFAGGDTGLLVRQIKVVGTGPMAREVEEAAVDTGLMREIRALQEQAAKELGQWVERSEIGADVVVRRYIGVDVDAV